MITVEKLQEALDKHLTHIFDCGNIQIMFDKNLTFHYIEGDAHDVDNAYEVIQYSLSFSFYDCHYELIIPKSAIDEDCSFKMMLSGDTKLYESFEDLLEDDLWPHMKIICAKYKELALKYEHENN